ncbi:NADP-dependent oxidoreductase domain-containing protein [Xylogone sp. PMI_703]|nr:NADP-dependent oxidoreductase domain-containing protein [Xylogone sp. PMI_703]
MAMKTTPLHKLGKNGPSIPPMGFGLMTIAGAHGDRPSDEEQFSILDRALELGDIFWDTADIYGDNLEVLAKWFRRTGKRDKIFLASKFGIIMGDNLQLKGFDSSAEYCKKACNDSLRRLGVDYIDLFYVHHINPDTPIEETMQAMVDLKAEGKIKHIGLCAASSRTLRRACKVAPVAAVQVEYSAFVLDIEGERGTNLLQTCRELGVAVVCFGPIGRGILTGTVTGSESISGTGDIRTQWVPRFQEDNLKKNLKVVNHFKALADRKGCTSAQLALAWVLKQGDNIFPIPGTKKIKYLEANWAALDIYLSDAEEAEIRKLVAGAELAGFETHPSAYVDTKELA